MKQKRETLWEKSIKSKFNDQKVLLIIETDKKKPIRIAKIRKDTSREPIENINKRIF